MSTVSRFVAVAMLLAVVLGGLFGWKYLQIREQAAARAQPAEAALVEVVSVQAQTWPESLSAIGSLRAVNGVRVANEIAGVVEEIQFSSGQEVKEGEVLVRLNADTDRAALETLQAEERLAVQQYRRISDLIDDNAVSQSDFDSALANLEAAKARVLEQRAILSKKLIRSPFTGVVGLRLVDKGQFLPVGTDIVEVVMRDPIYVDFTVSERDLTHIEHGNRVQVRVAAYPEREFSGEVEALNTSISPESRTVQVRALLANPEALLRAGMFANVLVFSGRQRDMLTVPRTAISYNTYGDFVFVLRREGGGTVVKRQQVTTGEVRNGRVAVNEGVQAGDRVVKAGLLRLRNGQAVKVKADSATGPATGGA